MTAMKPALDLAVDANVVLLLAFGLWALAQWGIVRSPLRRHYGLQLRLLRSVLVLVVLSPILSIGAILASQTLWPNAPITVSDAAVAAYLRGDIAMPAMEFEALLNTRSRIFDTILSGDVAWMNAALLMVLIGSLVLVAQTVSRALKVHRTVSNAYVWRRSKSTDIRLSDTVRVPFAARGLFRRHVVLPSSLLMQPEKLRIVMAHEFEHLRQNDVEWELLFEILRPVLYLNPAFLLWKRAFERLREFNCDQAVLESARVSPKAYAQCLLSFCERSVTPGSARTFNVAFIRTGSSSARNALEARIMALRDGRNKTGGTFVFASILAVLAVGIVLSAASVRNPGDWSQDRLTLSMIVNIDRYNASYSGF